MHVQTVDVNVGEASVRRLTTECGTRSAFGMRHADVRRQSRNNSVSLLSRMIRGT